MGDEPFKLVRAVGGLLAIVVLLSMIFLEFWVADLMMTWSRLMILLSIISALLGIDIARRWGTRWLSPAERQTRDYSRSRRQKQEDDDDKH